MTNCCISKKLTGHHWVKRSNFHIFFVVNLKPLNLGITKKAKDEDILLCSMDDHTVYGETIYKMSFGQAIERDLITDYKVVVICITDAEVRELVKEGSTGRHNE